MTATDLAGNSMSAAVSWGFTTLAARALSLFGNATPAVPSANDPSAVELGMKFSVGAPVELLGLRFFRGQANQGNQVGSLWTPDGTLILQVPFPTGQPVGWTTALLDEPVLLEAGDYVVSYFAPNGGYAMDPGFFAQSFVVGPLSAPSSGESGGNGVYRYGGGFPEQFMEREQLLD